ncbi:MAG: endonuclease NucS [Planktothrix sp. GU0601_MAG3]|nr:MAG: endonuclease NucS [Planktothrix sp. GU0601_MAG3]
MLNYFNLRKTGTRWEFETEETLEDFLFIHLQPVFSLTVLHRQYIVQGQRCDLLAVDADQRLVILELKNVEDRGIVQQLTRYYDAVLEEKPYAQIVDYYKPVQLIAIAPSFHRDNLTDRKYHKLEFQFLQFAVIQNADHFYLNLKDIDTQTLSSVKVPYQEPNFSDIPSPSQSFFKLIKNSDEQQKNKILEIRQKLLSFDKRMQEFSSAGSILYGNGNGKTSKYCAEFCRVPQGDIILFLWIPLKCGESDRISRGRIWTDWNEKALIEGYVASGMGTEINQRKRLIKNLFEKVENGYQPQENRFFSYCYYYHGNYRYSIHLQCSQKDTNNYVNQTNIIHKKIMTFKPVTYEEMKLIELDIKIIKEKTGIERELEKSPYKSLNNLIDLSLEKWLARI